MSATGACHFTVDKMKALMIIIGSMILVSCAHSGPHRYKFTCPDKSIVYADITQQEAQDSDAIYDRIIKLCKENNE